MAVITEIIQEQNFEKVSTRIGEILTLELANQKLLQPVRLSENVVVFKERITSIDKSEEVLVNVLLDGWSNSTSNQSNQNNGVNYFIDIYASGKENPTTRGDNVVATKVQKYAALCRYILQSHKYLTLDFPAGFIGNKNVEGFQMYEQPNTQDANFSRMGRLTFSVKLSEDQLLWDGIILDNNTTKVLLNDTDKGYQYKIKP